MIKIISGYSHAAGSTLALANLCNEFNSRGYACIFYGPDNWHIDKCASRKLIDFSPENGDTIIMNDIPLLSAGDISKINAVLEESRSYSLPRSLGRFLKKLLPSNAHSDYKLFLTCPSNDAQPLSDVRILLFRKIHFSSNALKSYFHTAHSSFIASSFCGDLKKSEYKPEKTGGIIGSIKKQNNIVEAIERALLDGNETVIIYGYMKDPVYYYDKIVPLTIRHTGRIKYAGFMDDRQKMFDSVTDVYSSVRKPWSVVVRECAMTHTRFHAPEPLNQDARMTKDQIFEIWKNELAL